MLACRVHACVMPYFGLAVNIFYIFYSCLLEASDNKICIGRLIFLCLCLRAYMHAHMCACLNCYAFLRCSSINFLTFYS